MILIFILLYYFLRQSFSLSVRLECSGAVIAHYVLEVLGSGDPPVAASRGAEIAGARHHTWLIFLFFVEMGFHHVAQCGGACL